MEITQELLHELMPRATDKNIARFYQPLINAMKEFEINTPLRVAAFLAQIAHESDNLYYVEEIADGSAYEYRKDLGNLEYEALQYAHQNNSTTGKWFKGHGLIQLTGYYNHKAISKALNIDCLSNPKLLCESEYASRSAAWFWNTHNCNSLADVGLFGKITRVINGGTDGITERLKNYANCKKVLEC